MFGPPRILVVDDEPNVRLVFRTALEASGSIVAEAEDGESALARLGSLDIDLVFLDLRMPGLGGMETLRRLRAGGSDVPVVIVTAHGSIPDAVEAMRLGAIDFLTKPLRPEVLRQTVKDVVARREEPVRPAPAPEPVAVVVAPSLLDLQQAKRALNLRDFDTALDLLETAVAQAPDSAEAHTLLGVLRETLGQNHAAFHAYRAALEVDPKYGPALENLRRYCSRQGLDFQNRAINPAART